MKLYQFEQVLQHFDTELFTQDHLQHAFPDISRHFQIFPVLPLNLFSYSFPILLSIGRRIQVRALAGSLFGWVGGMTMPSESFCQLRDLISIHSISQTMIHGVKISGP